MTVWCYSDPGRKLRYIPIPKCASTTIFSAMFELDGTVEHIHRSKPQRELWTPQGWPTFAVVRDPWFRFRSVWRNKVYLPHRPDTRLVTEFDATPGMSLAAFLDLVEDTGVQKMDEHVRRQASFLPPTDPVIEDVYLLRLPHLAEDARRVGLDWLADAAVNLNLNASKRIEDAEGASALRDRVARLYIQDVRLWRKANAR